MLEKEVFYVTYCSLYILWETIGYANRWFLLVQYNFLALNYTFLVMIKFLDSFESKLSTFFPKQDICTTDINLMFLRMKRSPPQKKILTFSSLFKS